jgi:hypothetical protein
MKLKCRLLNDLISNTNRCICENFGLEYFFNFFNKQTFNLTKKNITNDNFRKNYKYIVKQINQMETIRSLWIRKNIKIKLSIVCFILLFFYLLAMAGFIFIMFKVYIVNQKTSLSLIIIPLCILTCLIILNIWGCYIFGFDEFETKKYINLAIHSINFLSLLFSILGLIYHTEFIHIIIYSLFISFIWLVNISSTLYINTKTLKINKFIKKFIILEVLKWSNLNYFQYLILRLEILTEFCSMFKWRSNKVKNQIVKVRLSFNYKKISNRIWRTMFYCIISEIDALKRILS